MAFVAKQSLFKLPVIGTVLRALEAIGVDRRKGTNARQAIAGRLVCGSRSFAPCVFPEGTTTNGVGVIAFKTGAFAPGIAVLPVALKFECESGFDLSYTTNQMSTSAVLCHFLRMSLWEETT